MTQLGPRTTEQLAPGRTACPWQRWNQIPDRSSQICAVPEMPVGANTQTLSTTLLTAKLIPPFEARSGVLCEAWKESIVLLVKNSFKRLSQNTTKDYHRCPLILPSEILPKKSSHTAPTVVDSSCRQAVAEFSKMAAAVDVASPKDIWGVMKNQFRRST